VLNSARAGITHDVKEYPEAGHSFLKCQDTLLSKVLQVIHIGYNERAAEDARGRIVRFFQQHLGG
jgi:carboxymethylenebutenolidase